MKTLLLILLTSYACNPTRLDTPKVVEASVPPSETSPVLEFEKDIQPILQSHCSPCHFKDGKMYERMPFDRSKTLVDFQEGILGRLKNEEEVAKVREYLAQLN